MEAQRSVVTIRGDLRKERVREIRRDLDRTPQPDVIDIREARDIDSSGLHELARVAKRVLPRRIQLRVSSTTLRSVLYLVRLDEVFTITE